MIPRKMPRRLYSNKQFSLFSRLPAVLFNPEQKRVKCFDGEAKRSVESAARRFKSTGAGESLLQALIAKKEEAKKTMRVNQIHPRARDISGRKHTARSKASLCYLLEAN